MRLHRYLLLITSGGNLYTFFLLKDYMKSIRTMAVTVSLKKILASKYIYDNHLEHYIQIKPHKKKLHEIQLEHSGKL